MATEWDVESSDCAAMVAQRNMSEDFLDSASGPSMSAPTPEHSIDCGFVANTNLASSSSSVDRWGRRDGAEETGCRNFSPYYHLSSKLRAKALEQLTHVKLDRENITSIDKIRYILSLPEMTNLYLQQNGLKNLSGIEVAKGLKFLIVSNNQLTALHGLVSLPKLMVLDAAENSISRIDSAELPQSLSFLNVDGNPCCASQEGLREHLKNALPNLKELDGDPLTDHSCSDYSTESDETSEEDDEGMERASTEEDDHGGESKQRACRPQVFRATGDGGKDVTINGEGCSGSRWAETPSEGGSSRSSRRGASASCNQPLTQYPLPEIVERLGTSSSVERALGSNPIPHPDKALENVREEEMVEFYHLKDSLYESNLDSEGALQTVLSHTVGGLGHHCDMMIERAHERMKNLDVQLGGEIVQMFFSPESSPRSTCTSKEQSQEASSSGDISSSAVSPTSVDHWKYVASTSSDYSNCKGSSSVRNTDCVDLSYQESLTSEQEENGEVCVHVTEKLLQ